MEYPQSEQIVKSLIHFKGLFHQRFLMQTLLQFWVLLSMPVCSLFLTMAAFLQDPSLSPHHSHSVPWDVIEKSATFALQYVQDRSFHNSDTWDHFHDRQRSFTWKHLRSNHLLYFPVTTSSFQLPLSSQTMNIFIMQATNHKAMFNRLHNTIHVPHNEYYHSNRSN